MSRDNLRTLQKHADMVRNRLESGIIPDRRKNQVAEYTQFLQTELKRTLKKIEELQLSGSKK